MVERLLAKLVVKRYKKQLSQKQLADKIGWSQSKLSKFESKEDVNLKDVIEYCDGLNLEIIFDIKEKC